jgi:hypothetical protein
MRSEIIQILPCNNYDSFQYLDFYIYIYCFNIFKDYFNGNFDPRVKYVNITTYQPCMDL